MIIENVVEEGRVCDILDAAYRFAKQCNSTHIVFLNTFNPQSTLNENRFAVNFLKADENGNERLVYTNNVLLEIPDIDILYRAIYTYKTINKDYKKDVSIDVWTDYSNPAVYW